MNSTNETLLFDRFLIMYDLCVFTCIIFIFCISLYTCANVICIKLLLTYLLTYFLCVQLRGQANRMIYGVSQKSSPSSSKENFAIVSFAVNLCN